MIARRPFHGRARLSDLMIWATFVAPGVVLNKDGSLQTSYRFRGPDLASATEAGLAATMARVNNALRRLPTGWALHAEARRRVSDHYPDLIKEPPAAWLIDRERRAQYAETGTKLISEFFLTFSYLLPEDRTAKASKLLFENKPVGAERGMTEQIEAFRETVRQVVDLLEPLFPMIEPLDDAATLTYLHDCISWSSISVRPPADVQLFDSFLYDTDLLPGLEPKLGDRWIKLLGIHGFPTTTMPALLDRLNSLPFAYRWTSRFLFMDMALIEFKIVTLGGFILLPFAILDRTTSLAERALGYVIAAGLKIFALAVVVSFAFAILPSLELSEELTLTEAFTVIGTALTFLMLSIKAPALATSLVTGGPSLGIGAVGQTVATVAGTGAAAYYTVATAGRAVAASGRALTGKSGGESSNVTRAAQVGSSTRATTNTTSVNQSGKPAAVAAAAAVPRDNGGGGGTSVSVGSKKDRSS